MKFDKDVVLKHHFWILTALALPFALVAILLLVTSVSGSIDAVRKQLKSLYDQAAKTKDIKTPEEIELKKAEADLLAGHKDKAWKQAFEAQEPLFRWSKQVETRYQFADGLFAREVNLLKLPTEKKEWPEDKAGALLHGTLQFADDETFKLLDRDGKTILFHVTPELLKAGLIDQQRDKARVEVKHLNGQPKDVLVAVGFQQARYFNDPLTLNERLAFAKSYLTQIPPIINQIDPLRLETDDDGKKQLVGVVQLRAGNSWMVDPSAYAEDDGAVDSKARDKVIPPEGSKFLNFVAKDWKVQSDISDEAWIAQEDLWIQREIYRLIRVANDSLATFTEVSKDVKAKTATYRNPYFEITLTLKDSKQLDVKITNLLNRRQKIEAMKLRVRLSDNPKVAPEVFQLVTESKYADPLEPHGDPAKPPRNSRTIPVRLEGSQTRQGIFGLEQVLTWETAAVKRLDQIAIGAATGEVALSQKNMALGVKPFKEDKKADDAASTTEGPGGKGSSVAPSGGGPQGFGAPGKFGGGGGGAAAAAPLANGLLPERYLEVTPQFRRIPVAVVLIVDQNQVDRVQTAFNNSKLRFLMTQVLLNHYPKSLKPELPSEGGEDSKAPDSGKPGPSTTPGAGVPPGLGFPSGFGPTGPRGSGFPGGLRGPGQPTSPGSIGGAGAEASVAADEMETNMELVLYGIVTLYERFPPRPGQPTVAAEAPKTP